MPSPSVTYSFSNGTAADASQVNTNFTDLINGMSDGTKDLSVSALTCAGTATFNGNLNLGNSSADDISITGSLASSFPIKTTGVFDVGSATKGLLGVYFGNASNTNTAYLKGGVTTSSYTLTLPTGAPALGSLPAGISSSAMSFLAVSQNGKKLVGASGEATGLRWEHGSVLTVSSADYTILDTDGYTTIYVTTGNTDRTVTLPTLADNLMREIEVIKADTGTGRVIVDGEGAETINGIANFYIVYQNDGAKFRANATQWQSNVKEIVYAEYTSNSGQSTTDGGDYRFNFEDKVIDTRDAVTIGSSWVFTAPRTGLYQVAGMVTWDANAAFNAGKLTYLEIFKAGAAYRLLSFKEVQSSDASIIVVSVSGSSAIRLTAGQELYLAAFQNTGGNRATSAAGEQNWVSIVSVD